MARTPDTLPGSGRVDAWPARCPAAVLLVCGSRSLTGYPDARPRLLAALSPALAPGPLVLSGGATGPDRWAVDEARVRGLPWETLLPSGWRVASWGRDRWSPVPVYPLARNLALVLTAALGREAVETGRPVTVAQVAALAGVDPNHVRLLARGGELPVNGGEVPAEDARRWLVARGVLV